MLTRDKLTIVQWQAVRNTPHHVIIAVSASGGSPFDDMLERSAGLQRGKAARVVMRHPRRAALVMKAVAEGDDGAPAEGEPVAARQYPDVLCDLRWLVPVLGDQAVDYRVIVMVPCSHQDGDAALSRRVIDRV